MRPTLGWQALALNELFGHSFVITVTIIIGSDNISISDNNNNNINSENNNTRSSRSVRKKL